jgi:hypothetical protein
MASAQRLRDYRKVQKTVRLRFIVLMDRSGEVYLLVCEKAGCHICPNCPRG